MNCRNCVWAYLAVVFRYGQALAQETTPIAKASSRGNWPSWRGPHATGTTDEKDLPLTWSPTNNIRWKTPLPDKGNSTPIIWGDRIFLTQAFDGGKRRALLAFSRLDGRLLWQREVPCSVDETTHRDNPPCSSSPVTDGEAVYAYFASAGVVAYDFNGKKLWHRDLGPILSKHGNGGSPVLYKNLLIVYHGPGEPKTFLTALDKRTGETIWTKPETGINSPIFGSWATPLIVHVGNDDELILPLPGERIGGEGEFKGYNPLTGEELWRCAGLGNEVYTSAALSPERDLIVGISGHNGPTMAMKLGGRGNLTGSNVLWRQKSSPQRIGNAIVHNGLVFLADADGMAVCIEARAGKMVWKERLSGKLWGSMLLAGDRLYVSNLEGKTFVLAASRKAQLLSTNDLAEPIYAALAVSNGEVFVRTWKHLYCISNAK